jgi:hypothetical protein
MSLRYGSMTVVVVAMALASGCRKPPMPYNMPPSAAGADVSQAAAALLSRERNPAFEAQSQRIPPPQDASGAPLAMGGGSAMPGAAGGAPGPGAMSGPSAMNGPSGATAYQPPVAEMASRYMPPGGAAVVGAPMPAGPNGPGASAMMAPAMPGAAAVAAPGAGAGGAGAGSPFSNPRTGDAAPMAMPSGPAGVPLSAAPAVAPMSTPVRQTAAAPSEDDEWSVATDVVPAGGSGAGAMPSQAELARIMGELQALGAQNPELQQRLFQELQRTPPEGWPALEQAFQAQAAALRSGGPPPAPPVAPGMEPGAGLMPGVGPSTGAAAGTPQATGAGTPQAPGVGAAGQTTMIDNEGALPSLRHRAVPSFAPDEDLSQPKVKGPLASFPVGPASAAGGAGNEMRSASTGGASAGEATPEAMSRVTMNGATAPGTAASAATAEAKPLSEAPAPAPENVIERVSYTPAAVAMGWREQVLAARQAMEQEANAGSAEGRAGHGVRSRLLSLVAGRREEALAPAPGLSAEAQDFYGNALYAIDAHLDATREADAGRRAATAVEALEKALAAARNEAPLEVRNLTLCTEVKSFGIYEPFPKAEFTPGQEVLVYCEVENFRYEPRPDGFRTALRGSMQFLDATGMPVGEIKPPVTDDLWRQRRRDFFLNYSGIYIPQGLNPGKYRVQLLVEDAIGNKSATAGVDFTVVAGP